MNGTVKTSFSASVMSSMFLVKAGISVKPKAVMFLPALSASPLVYISIARFGSVTYTSATPLNGKSYFLARNSADSVAVNGIFRMIPVSLRKSNMSSFKYPTTACKMVASESSRSSKLVTSLPRTSLICSFHFLLATSSTDSTTLESSGIQWNA